MDGVQRATPGETDVTRLVGIAVEPSGSASAAVSNVKELAVSSGHQKVPNLESVADGVSLLGQQQALVWVLPVLVSLAPQMVLGHHVPWVFWLVVLNMNVMGTVVTDCVVFTQLGVLINVGLVEAIVIFAILLACTLLAWLAVSRSVTLRSINTKTAESFFWVAAFFNFTLGTTVTNAFVDATSIPYYGTIFIFVGVMLAMLAANSMCRLPGVVAFWVSFLCSRPVGASLGDLLAKDPQDGGAGAGCRGMTIFFLCLSAVGIIAAQARQRIPNYNNRVWWGLFGEPPALHRGAGGHRLSVGFGLAM